MGAGAMGAGRMRVLRESGYSTEMAAKDSTLRATNIGVSEGLSRGAWERPVGKTGD